MLAIGTAILEHPWLALLYFAAFLIVFTFLAGLTKFYNLKLFLSTIAPCFMLANLCFDSNELLQKHMVIPTLTILLFLGAAEQ
jgi:hypothetical protein